MKTIIPLLAVFFFTNSASGQCPTITCPATLTLTSCQSGQTVMATSNYSANITSRWIGPGNIPIASIGTSTTVVNLNCIGSYTVEFKDNLSNCVVLDSIHVYDVSGKPNFNVSVSSFNMFCISSTVMISLQNTITFPIPGAPVSYTITGPPTSSIIPTGILGTVSLYTLSTCGIWAAYVKDGNNSCLASYSFVIGCSTLVPTPLLVSGSNTVCLGSSVTYSSNGTSNFWSTGASGATMNVIPSVSTTYSVSGNDSIGCPSSGNVAVTVNTTCSQVWPGDANSDGVVDNTDVFEIGLALNATGSSRTPGGNTYISQFATNWSGAVSSGSNLCHADCNGDSAINLNDTTAISANFLLTHAFKSVSTTNDPIVSIVSQPIANAGLWNKADIYLGNSNNTINQLYGVAFDLNYDQTLLENDSVYLTYTPSFLNSSGQNIEFKKLFLMPVNFMEQV